MSEWETIENPNDGWETIGKKRTIGGDVMEAIGNVPGSAAKLAGDIVQPFLHPIDTATGLKDLFVGTVQSALPESMQAESARPQREMAGRVADFYKQRYGGAENIRNTLVQDPVGAAADAASILGIAGIGLKASGLSKAGNIASSAGNIVDPINLAGKAITKGVAPVSKAVYSKVLGTTTGSPYGVKAALEGGDTYRQAMRDTITDSDLVNMATESFDTVRKNMTSDYHNSLKSLKGANQSLDISDIHKMADDWLDKYNVKKVGKDLDFSRSTATGKAAEEIEQVYRIVKDWGSKPDDLTPAMLDTLKRKIGNFYATDRISRAMTQSLKKAVHEKVATSVPEYRKMTTDYAKKSEFLDSVESAISSGDRSKADAVLRKMTTAIREDKSFRRDLLKQLGEEGGNDLIAAASGRTMSQPFANRMGPMLTSAAGAGGMFYSPWMASLFAISSPRLVGEVSYYLGKTGRGSAKVAKSISDRGGFLAAQQAGRLPIYEEE